jgi:hypothetical protein
MKTKKNIGQNGYLAPDSQKRLIAYTTAASLGALFTGQSAEGQVVESMAFAPYPATLPAAAGTNTTDFPFDVDGDGSNDFQFVIFGQTNVLSTPPHSQVADVDGFVNSLGTTNQCINDKGSSYLHAWLGGETISSATGVPTTYKPRLAVAYYYGLGNPPYIKLDNKFPATGAVGFKFVSGLDNQVHFGYMDVRANSKQFVVNGVTNNVITSVTINDVYYNKTPNAGITVPVSVAVTNINLGPGNLVTIGFTSNTNTPASAFTLLTSPTLGPSANWTPDSNAVITNTLAANPNNKKPLSLYQAATITNGAPSQFYRLSY